jgi:hypothetical protein
MFSCNSIRIKIADSEGQEKNIYVIPDIKKGFSDPETFHLNLKDSCPPGMSIGEIEFKYGRAESIVCYEKEKK